jgi:hypothetical protein
MPVKYSNFCPPTAKALLRLWSKPAAPVASSCGKLPFLNAGLGQNDRKIWLARTLLNSH